MASKRWVWAFVAAGGVASAVAAGTAWAGGPGGTVEDTPADLFAAVGSGTFEDLQDGAGGNGFEVGFTATGPTAEAAQTAVISACQAAGGVDCTADEYTNDNLCIVSAFDPVSHVVAGGAGPDVEAARLDAIARSAANGTPLPADTAVLISSCP